MQGQDQAPQVSNGLSGTIPTPTPRADTKKAPAAMDLVQMYRLTFFPQGTACPTLYTVSGASAQVLERSRYRRARSTLVPGQNGIESSVICGLTTSTTCQTRVPDWSPRGSDCFHLHRCRRAGESTLLRLCAREWVRAPSSTQSRLVGSSRSPDTMACVGHTISQEAASHLDAMRTKIALRRGVGVRVNVQRIVGAGLHAGFATNTHVRVKSTMPSVRL